MSSARPLSPMWWWFLAVIPFLFILYTWIVSDGIPYFTDANETYSAFIHAKNMYTFRPTANAFLTDDANTPGPAGHPFTYTHQPNLPRYISYVMLLLGVGDLRVQVLIGALAGTGLAIGFLLALFRPEEPGVVGPLILALFVTDFFGVLQWTGNLFRVWHLPLFWGCLLCTRKPSRPILSFVLFFILFQFEFAFAVFTSLTCLGRLLLVRRSERPWAAAVAGAGGAVVSVLLFVTQLLLFLGWSGFLYDLAVTYTARNSTSVTWESIQKFYESQNIVMWPSFPTTNHGFSKFIEVTSGYLALMYGRDVRDLAYLSVFLSGGLSVLGWTFRNRLSKEGPVGRLVASNNALACFLWPMLAAYLFLGIAMSGYTLTAYTQRWCPMLVFPMLLSLALLVFNTGGAVRAVLERCAAQWDARRIGRWAIVLTSVGMLVLWIGNSVSKYRQNPPFINEAAALLLSKYRGGSVVSSTTYPHMIAYYTKSWAYYSPLVFNPREPISMTYNWNADRFTNPDYQMPEYYLCQRVPYMRGIDCDQVGGKFEEMGYWIVARGKTFVIVELNRRVSDRQR